MFWATRRLSPIKQSMEIDPLYITGFVDGEGSFLVSFSRREKIRVGIEARPSFTISQNQRSKEVLDEIATYFQCGNIRYNTHDQTYKYEVRSLDDLCRKIIPHFEQYPLRTSKKKDFEVFKVICGLMIDRHHRTVDGINKIMEMAYTMNGVGARRYTKESLLRIVER